VTQVLKTNRQQQLSHSYHEHPSLIELHTFHVYWAP